MLLGIACGCAVLGWIGLFVKKYEFALTFFVATAIMLTAWGAARGLA